MPRLPRLKRRARRGAPARTPSRRTPGPIESDQSAVCFPELRRVDDGAERPSGLGCVSVARQLIGVSLEFPAANARGTKASSVDVVLQHLPHTVRLVGRRSIACAYREAPRLDLPDDGQPQRNHSTLAYQG